MLFFVFVERMGVRALAISQIIRGIYIFAMVPIFSLADATNSFVSNLMGEGGFGKIIPVIKRTIILGLIGNVFFYLLINLYPELVIGLFTKDALLSTQSINTLRVACLSMFIFTLGFIPFRAISGTGNTLTALFIELVSVLTYLYYVNYAIQMSYPLYVVWIGEFIYFGLMIILSWGYLRFGKWRAKMV